MRVSFEGSLDEVKKEMSEFMGGNVAVVAKLSETKSVEKEAKQTEAVEEKPKKATKAAKTEPAKTEPVKAEESDGSDMFEETAPEKELSLADVNAALQAFHKKHGTGPAKELLGKFSVQRIGELKAKDYKAFVKAATEE